MFFFGDTITLARECRMIKTTTGEHHFRLNPYTLWDISKRLDDNISCLIKSQVLCQKKKKEKEKGKKKPLAWICLSPSQLFVVGMIFGQEECNVRN